MANNIGRICGKLKKTAPVMLCICMLLGNVSTAFAATEDVLAAGDKTEQFAEMIEDVPADGAFSDDQGSVSDTEESTETEETAEEISDSETEKDDDREDACETAAEPETPEDVSGEIMSVTESTEAEAGIDPAGDDEGEDTLMSEAGDQAETVEDESSEEMVIEDVILQQLADGELIAPIDVHWDPEVPAGIVYKAYADQEAFYFAEFYKDGSICVTYNIGDVKDDNPEESGGYYLVKDNFDIHISDLGSGTYKFRVKAGTDSNDDDFETGAVSEWSEDFVYTEPETRLADPQNVRWSSTEPSTLMWDAVPNGYRYWLTLYADGEEQAGYLTIEGESKLDVSFWLGDVNEHEYTVSVKAIPKKIYEYAASNAVFSEPLNQNVSGQTQVLKDKKNAVNSASSRQEAEQSIRDLWNEIDIDEMKLSMQTKEAVRDAVGSLEDTYTDKAGISVRTTVTPEAGIGTGEDAVSILGAGLNAAAGASVTFTIDKADAHDDHIIDTSLWVNVTRFDMDIDGVVTDSEGNLMFPVTVTMPIPANVKNHSTMRILHYHHSDNGYDLIEPRINSDGTASFTVTHFSEFVFAEEKPDTTVKPGDTEIVTELGTVLKLSKPISGVRTQQAGQQTSSVYLIPKDTVITGSFKMHEMRRWDWMDESADLDTWPLSIDDTSYYQTFTMTFKGGDGYEVPQYLLYLYPDGSPEYAFHMGPFFEWDMRDSMFTDVKKSTVYYFDPVYWAVENGITKGYSDGSFGVGRNCERRELMIFLWRYAGQPTGYGDARTMFNDLSSYGPTSATNQAIAWAYKTGITKGYSDGGFHPKSSIVRKDVMIMLYRLADKPAVSGTLTFKDCQNLKKGTDTYNAILWGFRNGITNGYSSGQYKGMFGNNLNCLREQIVTFLYRFSKL